MSTAMFDSSSVGRQQALIGNVKEALSVFSLCKHWHVKNAVGPTQLASLVKSVCSVVTYKFLCVFQETRRRQLAEAAEKRQKEVGFFVCYVSYLKRLSEQSVNTLGD